jgi:hypothetical protein
MLDTFQISKTFVRSPELSALNDKGWQSRHNMHTGEPTALYFNGPKHEYNPRLTLSRNRNDGWIIRAEVALGSWLHGSNLHLPNEEELYYGLDLLSEYVVSNSGIPFDARAERVTRVDFTRDFQVGENAVIPIIAKFAEYDLSRYSRVCFDNTSVYFKNSGKERTKEYLIYSKHHERLANSKDILEHEKAKGIIRLESSFRKSGVARLAKSLKLKSHHANHILTKETSEKVIQTAIERLNFRNLLTFEKPKIEQLFESCTPSTAFSRIGFLYMKEKYGNDLTNLSFIDVSRKTLKRYEDDCRRAGILSLE